MPSTFRARGAEAPGFVHSVSTIAPLPMLCVLLSACGTEDVSRDLHPTWLPPMVARVPADERSSRPDEDRARELHFREPGDPPRAAEKESDPERKSLEEEPGTQPAGSDFTRPRLESAFQAEPPRQAPAGEPGRGDSAERPPARDLEPAPGVIPGAQTPKEDKRTLEDLEKMIEELEEGNVETKPGTEPPAQPPPPREESSIFERLDLGLDLTGAYWMYALDGTMLITKGGHPGTGGKIDVGKALGLEPDSLPQVAASIRLGDHRGGFELMPLRSDGQTTLSEPLIYHAQTFPAGSQVESSLDFDVWSAHYDYRLVHESAGDLWLGLGGYYWDFDSTLESADAGLSEHRGFTAVFPSFRTSGELRHGIFSVGAQVAGGLLTDSYFVDLRAGAGITWGNLELSCGYRFFHVDITETTNLLEFDYQGPFIGLSLKLGE